LTPPIPATRLICLQTLSLFNCGERGHPHLKYATLSYCWGQTSQFKATKANIEDLYRGFRLDNLSQTVRDAVEVTRSLGLPYLWVDALCIIQDDEDDKSREIELMATIYKNAAVTIAALSASGTTEGFLRVPRQGSRALVARGRLGQSLSYSKSAISISARRHYAIEAGLSRNYFFHLESSCNRQTNCSGTHVSQGYGALALRRELTMGTSMAFY